ncbi:hypothetical protein AALO_G00245490 [Alosa alosa]|uniref:Uncharacterized protein n=1 Tax=Alosa alosa TaxID=278164 RepID=A0AAV6FVJ3_9TELE|nr:hypothetical protein AALO_G00245490 [Alosa alosa]
MENQRAQGLRPAHFNTNQAKSHDTHRIRELPYPPTLTREPHQYTSNIDPFSRCCLHYCDSSQCSRQTISQTRRCQENTQPRNLTIKTKAEPTMGLVSDTARTPVICPGCPRGPSLRGLLSEVSINQPATSLAGGGHCQRSPLGGPVDWISLSATDTSDKLDPRQGERRRGSWS